MTDATEQRLLKEYNAALAALKKIPRGDPRHIRASARLINAQRAIKQYRRRNQN